MLKSFLKFDKTSGFPADYSTHVVPYKELKNLYLKASTTGIFKTCSDRTYPSAATGTYCCVSAFQYRYCPVALL